MKEDLVDKAAPWRVVWALAVTQIVSWGSLYYAFALLLGPIEAELHWARTSVVGAFSVSLLVAGVAAFPAGALIDRFGGRMPMALGSLCAAALLALVAVTHSLMVFYLLWAGLGLCMAATLYEPAFAVIYRSFRADARKAVTALTLVAGFASTVFWPLTGALVEKLGWRGAVGALALLNLLVCFPLHVLMLEDAAARGAGGRAEVRRPLPLRAPAFWLLGVVFTANMLAFSALSVHLVPLLSERGLSMVQTLMLVALVGPMQVAGRIVEYLLGRRVSAVASGVTALASLPVALVLLAAGGSRLALLGAAIALYGASNGVMTIVRAVVPADLFGRERYGALNGALSVPVVVSRAAGPVAASLLWSAGGGYGPVLYALASIAALALVAFWLAIRNPPRE